MVLLPLLFPGGTDRLAENTATVDDSGGGDRTVAG